MTGITETTATRFLSCSKQDSYKGTDSSLIAEGDLKCSALQWPILGDIILLFSNGDITIRFLTGDFHLNNDCILNTIRFQYFQ